MSTNPYGRPYRRRKLARFTPGVPCSICGEPIHTRAEFTLHHDPPIADGGNAFDERPAHKTCNARHGGQLGARRSRRDPDHAEAVPSRPRSSSASPKVWEGAIAIPLAGPVEVHHADGSVIRVPRGRRYVP